MDTGSLVSQVSAIIGQLHGLFDEIGVPGHEREERESELFAALSETLNNQVRRVTNEKNDMTEEAQHIITTIRQMENSLNDNKSRHEYETADDGLKITYPLTRCLQVLKEKHLAMARLHRERFEQVQKLAQALESYASHLEPSFIKITLPPSKPNASIPPTFDLSPSYVEALDDEFTRVYEEYTRRISAVKTLAESIIQLWAELGTPQAQTDGMIVKYYRDAPEQLGLHEDDISRLRSKRDKLADEKKARERRLKDLRATVEGLWDRLGIEEPERKRFLNGNRGCGVRQINEFEDELARLNELKRQNLHLFVEEARYKLQELWDSLYFSEDEMLEFTPAFSDVYSDALLEAHEQEISRLEALREQRAPTLALIDKHRSLVSDRNELAASSQDASRLMMRGQKGEKRDPTRLLREEKMRKRIAKELPKIAADLRKILEQWEDEYGRPFLVHGERYLDELEAADPPQRSKTPVGSSTTAKKVGTIGRSNTINIPTKPPAPSKTPVSGGNNTLRRNPFASSVSTNGGRTPSRIPARTPLSNLDHGNNSPERKVLESKRSDGTIRKMGPPPARVPPPRMRDLMPPLAPTPASHTRHESEDSMIVRHISPEDVYDDQQFRHSRSQSHYDHSTMRLNERLPPAPPSRQLSQLSHHSNTSGTSGTATTVSGSENWETYDDASEPEEDATEEYYARLRATHNKRFTPEYGPPGGQKKSRGLPPYGGQGGHGGIAMIDAEGNRIPSGSESNWTDEDAY
ncbi:microtubule associated protein-domain-containing protein [Xylogone sp. PMI_703]|nr:microtubule associated protein-domain-containing protein [Xylogone sp. PMI_703]